MSGTPAYPDAALQLRTLVTEAGLLQLSLASVPVPAPSDDQVLVRVDAAPINPSDLGLLLAGADLSTALASGTPVAPVTTASIPQAVARTLAARIGHSLVAGNEGAGVVVAAGSGAAAQALLGRTVAVLGGEMYSQYRCVHVSQTLLLPGGTTPEQGASCFVNPLTALGMVGTMRLEGHRGLVHTAAASNLGQMLVKLCLADGVPLVNIVRSPEQVALLRSIGATHVCNSTSPDFTDELTTALVDTGATLAFDAIGGGRLASQILTAMEAAATSAAAASGAGYSRYGSTTHKQVYIYGGLDRGPTELQRSFGMAWSIGGWLLTPFLQRVGGDEVRQLRERVAAEITTTFTSHYTRRVSLVEALDLDTMRAYARQATGEKFLITPNAS
jgi:NADPH2:quinone reductase